ncbi:hypothetical protein SK128_022818, partial [Halocaridina rubra]
MLTVIWAIPSRKCRISKELFSATPVLFKLTQHLQMLTPTWHPFTRTQAIFQRLF